MGPIGCPETSITNHQPALRNIPEERRYQEWVFLVHLTIEIEALLSLETSGSNRPTTQSPRHRKPETRDYNAVST